MTNIETITRTSNYVTSLSPHIKAFSLGSLSDKSTWIIDWTGQQQQADVDAAAAAIAAFDPDAATVDDIVMERKRRLALGFAYDFGDARGVHHIGTTLADMEGWRDVIDYANALVDLGDVTTQIAIVTDTGPAAVTAPEWQAVMLQAAQVRQLLWAKSFALQAMNPIPTNYADDSYWA